MIPPRPVPLLSYVLFLWLLLEKIDAVIYSGPKGASSGKNYRHLQPDFTIQKVTMTQRGYIQFLKYTSKVPTLTDYTFCIWVRSHNLTHNHPLLSYSKHEEDRLIRVWISEKGHELSLEILDHLIFKATVNLVENVWYHVCQSWSAQEASWDLYLNRKLKSSGIVPKLRGVPIEGGGDIVVGQEYTDFDKGLDDGIEGDVSGFNFVLSSTVTAGSHHPLKAVNYPLRRRFDERHRLYPPKPLYSGLGNQLSNLEYFPRRRFVRNVFQGAMNLFQAEAQASSNALYKYHGEIPIYHNEFSGRRISNEIIYDHPKSLGLLLVELSFDCGLKKGAPLSGKGVLISWTKSPVRVFGGAILKKIPPFCRTAGS